MNKMIGLCLNQVKPSFRLASTAGVTLSLCTNLFVSSVNAASETARSADSFVDSIGVNTHLYYQNSAYYQKYEELIKPKLLELGVRHIRDGGTRNLNGYLDRLKELAKQGIRCTLSFDPRTITPQEAVALNKELGKDVVAGVQGPNEYNNSGDSNWVNTLRNYQQQLFKAIKGDSATASLPVYGPSLTSEDAINAVGDLSNSIDYAAMPNYYSGRHPGTQGWGFNGYGSLKWNVDLIRKYGGSKPVVTVETGYHNTTSAEGHMGVPEEVAGKYYPRLFLEQFNYGIHRTFGYELINESNDGNNLYKNFGLLRHDGSEKPAFVALKNLIRVLKDPGPNFTPTALDYVLSGNTTNVHHTLLQKRDKKFYLVLWQEVSGFEVNARQYINVPTQQVTLTLNTPIAKATTYLPNKSTQWVKQDTNPKQITLDVPDYPMVVELEPS
ncbi:hypothetical protein [Chroococcidiopsis sp. CCMEE 29]|uniref:hypothetical protein n=1 Tax=Chroococcidiopsis sp. CCMEE 29 TaxID=155894 RepID=UPI0020205365|nr:hypothetical protein [Chroococcidiopsis sp. CCMEE 29]